MHLKSGLMRGVAFKISPRLPNMESEWPYKRATTVHDLMLEKNVCIKISIIPSRDDLQKKYLFP
jgi:hypothetical protein